MIFNGYSLLEASPIKNMLTTKETAHGVSHGLSELGYDIRLKQDIVFYGGENPRIDLIDGAHKKDTWGRFCRASAMEEFDMPDFLGGIVHDKSTWARQGLSVFNTVIESGWKGFLTLELVYHGNDILRLPAGCGIAQVVFHSLTDNAAYKGKYQNQPDRPVSAIHS